ncbi:hypothetical protein PMAYCL1PPCAC_07120 [Pristionchus mayeri]|uniref:Domain of unknown function DB domain-containing protein n=1 Tax=Pristionchus mayeri TaxID=1317129 RepID=A0AAN4ZFU4_9BILA|nr:hypothetical protein PMAYCL1PPCAC_07120 [Pristionchus mayeri]
MTALLLLLSSMPTVSFACVASGICGGGLPGLGLPPPPGGCFGAIPPVAPSCMGGGPGGIGMGGGCGAGYSCGAYGCYQVRRARAHSALTLQSPPTPSESRLSLFGASRFSQSTEGRAPIPSDPNSAFMACCESRGLPDACLQKCTYNTYTKESLTRMYFKQDACPLAASAEIQFCAAQGRDHRECCARYGLIMASPYRCLTFCDQRPGNVTMLDMSYIGCYDRFENMKSCFWHDVTSRLSAGQY